MRVASGENAWPIASEADLLSVRNLLRADAKNAGLGTVAQTKLITAASELVRNILRYGGGHGEAIVSVVADRDRLGVRARFTDVGPGIADVDQALRDGFSTGGSLGVGLPGAKRLVDEFNIESSPGAGTTVEIIKWR